MAKKNTSNKDNHIIIGEVPSDSDPNIFYLIGIDKILSEKFNHVHFTCNCTSFKFSGKGGVERHCKHTLSLIKNVDFLRLDKGIISRGDLEKIVGYELNKRNEYFIFVAKIGPTLSQVIGNLLTEIICPYITCGHVSKGSFKPQEFYTCEHCKKAFMPE